jgi:alpha-glucosidase
VALARRHNNEWFVAAITDWTARDLDLDLSFLDLNKVYTVELFRDGINANTRANDYKKEIKKVKKGDQITVSLASGGGWVARIYCEE